jgi:hypothetical protein
MIAFKSLLLAWKVFVQMVVGQENLPTFQDLESMLLLEDNRMSNKSNDNIEEEEMMICTRFLQGGFQRRFQTKTCGVF